MPTTRPGDFRITFKLDSKEADRRIALAERSLTPTAFAAFLRRVVVDRFRERAARRFRDEGDNASGEWAPLKDSTNQIREDAGFSPMHPINVRTGALRAAVVSARGRTSPMSGGAQLEWPSQMDFPQGTWPKYRVAQMGAKARMRYGPTVPRPVVATDEEDAAWILQSLEHDLKNALDGRIVSWSD